MGRPVAWIGLSAANGTFYDNSSSAKVPWASPSLGHPAAWQTVPRLPLSSWERLVCSQVGWSHQAMIPQLGWSGSCMSSKTSPPNTMNFDGPLNIKNYACMITVCYKLIKSRTTWIFWKADQFPSHHGKVAVLWPSLQIYTLWTTCPLGWNIFGSPGGLLEHGTTVSPPGKQSKVQVWNACSRPISYNTIIKGLFMLLTSCV